MKQDAPAMDAIYYSVEKKMFFFFIPFHLEDNNRYVHKPHDCLLKEVYVLTLERLVNIKIFLQDGDS